ncbi:unnamed protein product [Dovyalis caffra]|uniref:Low-temperature-induced 65 kDa protein n=1 Tax=Dovyalis caffra TaxID=77055 RepID=A0AAV1RNJ8_9ROSI|nr:unnamed protein product [Dovyalis caffra]
MESQVARPHGVHQYEHDPNNAGLHPEVEGEDEQHHEKKSVLKKVKDKAKKLKDKVKLHGHGHDEHHEGHVPGDHDLYEEDDEDEDEEMVEDPEIHGASAYDSGAIRSSVQGQGGRLGDPRTYYGSPTTKQEEHTGTDPMKSFLPGEEEDELGPPKVLPAIKEHREPVNLPASISPAIVEQTRHADPVGGVVHEQERIRGQHGLEEDPHAPKAGLGDHAPSNYQIKVTDPTGSGGKEAGIAKILHSFDKMNVYDESKQGEKQNLSTGLRDGQLSMQEEHTGTDPMKSFVPGEEEDELGPPKVLLGRTAAIKEVPRAPVNSPAIVEQTRRADPVRGVVHEQERIRGQPDINLNVPVGLEEDPHAPKAGLDGHAPSNYQTKVTDPTGSGGKEAGITPILHSFDRMSVYDESKQGEKQNSSTGLRDGQFSMLPTGSHDQFSAEPTPPMPISTLENPESDSKSLDVLKDKEHPCSDIADKPSTQSSYTEKISSATSAIADKAKAATDVIASKLGYGERGNTIKEHEMAHEGQNPSKPASSVEYGKKIAATVTEKLTPVYEKVHDVGSTVTSKVHGNTNTSTNTSNEADRRIKGQDRGLSVKNYFAEKLRPGEEDRALSEVISETLNKGKGGARMGKKDKPMGKVTESEEVKRRLGSVTEENSGGRMDSASVYNPGMAVVDKLKGAVGSLFVKGAESRASQQHPLSSSNAVSGSVCVYYD